jgi:hypothetical protein
MLNRTFCKPCIELFDLKKEKPIKLIYISDFTTKDSLIVTGSQSGYPTEHDLAPYIRR